MAGNVLNNKGKNNTSYSRKNGAILTPMRETKFSGGYEKIRLTDQNYERLAVLVCHHPKYLERSLVQEYANQVIEAWLMDHRSQKDPAYELGHHTQSHDDSVYDRSL